MPTYICHRRGTVCGDEVRDAGRVARPRCTFVLCGRAMRPATKQFGSETEPVINLKLAPKGCVL
jgi:hypothetical protein